MDRNNYSGVTKIEDVTHNKTDEQLQTELKHLLDTIDTAQAPIVQVIEVDDNEDTKH